MPDRTVKSMELLWIVINPDGSYAGVPCTTWEEARELKNAKEGRRVFIIDAVIDEVTDSESGLL